MNTDTHATALALVASLGYGNLFTEQEAVRKIQEKLEAAQEEGRDSRIWGATDLARLQKIVTYCDALRRGYNKGEFSSSDTELMLYLGELIHEDIPWLVEQVQTRGPIPHRCPLCKGTKKIDGPTLGWYPRIIQTYKPCYVCKEKGVVWEGPQ